MTDDLRPASIELTLPLEVSSVHRACVSVLDWIGNDAPAPRIRTTIELVIEEVVMNIVRHAFDDPGGRHFTLRASRNGPWIRLQFEDTGRAFDPTTAPVRDAPVAIESAVPGGLGLPLLRLRTHAMHYERKDGRNLLSVTIALHPQP